jgi:two-component system chemotaxis response regulator CheY
LSSEQLAVETPTRPIRILVVEDDEDMSDTLCELLEDCGYEPFAAHNGQAALDHLRACSAPPSIILLDIMMPVLDGRGFRRAQLAEPSFCDIPVIVLTAQPDVATLCAELNITGFLRKPVRLDPLLAMIKQYAEPSGPAGPTGPTDLAVS